MNRLGLAAIGYTPDDKEMHPDEGNASEIIITRQKRVHICALLEQSWRCHK